MKNTFVFLLALAFACSVGALDNTLVDDFWDTRGYVNGSTNEVTGVSSVLVDAPVKSVAVSDAPADFSTFACGTVFMFR